jgi:hypothetical protein
VEKKFPYSRGCARENEEELASARELVLVYFSVLRARQTLQKIHFGNRDCEQD